MAAPQHLEQSDAGRMIARSLSIAAALVTGVSLAHAATPKMLGKHRSWIALQAWEDSERECYAYAEPIRKRGGYNDRGPAYVQVVHRPGENRTNEVVLVAGYTYKKGSSVEVRIGRHRFSMFTDKDAAWTPNHDADKALIRAMKRGRRMVVRGRSTFGVQTTDTYSLFGFSAAHRAISKACGVR
jgi:hypothetical protein